MNRRALLASLGSTAAVGAGCVAPLRDAAGPSVRLGWFGVHNADTESDHRFDLEVWRDGARVHRSSHEVPAAREFDDGGQRNDGAVAEYDWGSTPGEYVVRVRADGGDWAEESVSAFAASEDVDCAIADAEYRSTLHIYLVAGCDRDGYEGTCSFVDE